MLDQRALVDQMVRPPRNGNTGVAGGKDRGPVQGIPVAGAADAASPSMPDRSQWNTKGYATPEYTASKFGGPLAGFDAAKWNDANYQDPKYVFGRILSEAAGDAGNLKDAGAREKAVGNILKAYPGAKFDGKDKIIMPDGGVIDIFGAAGSGDYIPTFQVVPGTGRAPDGTPLPAEVGPALGAAASAVGSPFGASVPTDAGFFQKLLEQIRGSLGNPDQNALLALMGKQ